MNPVGEREVNQMQVKCPECLSTATIQSRKELDVKISDLYCSCKNPECGHSFVSTLSFKHSLSPSSFQARRMLIEHIKSLSIEEQQSLFSEAAAI